MSHIGSKPTSFHIAIGEGVTTWLGVCTTGVVSWSVACCEQSPACVFGDSVTIDGVVKSGAWRQDTSSSSRRRMCEVAGLRGTSGLSGVPVAAKGGGASNETEGVHAATPFNQFVCLLVA